MLISVLFLLRFDLLFFPTGTRKPHPKPRQKKRPRSLIKINKFLINKLPVTSSLSSLRFQRRSPGGRVCSAMSEVEGRTGGFFCLCVTLICSFVYFVQFAVWIFVAVVILHNYFLFAWIKHVREGGWWYTNRLYLYHIGGGGCLRCSNDLCWPIDGAAHVPGMMVRCAWFCACYRSPIKTKSCR